ncbi:unnamed protein product [Miscanthus lutarioriparius]|uniref:Uncharacterized protein n=1 Tax=Miscanthus lutarioriparius TaxID=422564 RepID=A0A811S0A1_9POAL|nr:unnamed protein product [Miscanthus lutarioriparius]
MGKKGKWFGAVKKVFSPESKEKKEELLLLHQAEEVRIPEAEQEQSKHVTVEEAPAAPAQASVLPPGVPTEVLAAIKIQTAFRGYLRTDRSTHDEVGGRCGFVLRHFYRGGRGKPPHRESSTSARSERTPPRSDGDGSAAGVQGWGATRAAVAHGIGEEIGSASMSRGKGEGASVVRAWIERSAARRSEQQLRGGRAEGEEGDRRPWALGWASCATAVPPRRHDRGSGAGRLAWGDYGGGEAIRTNHKITSGSF